MKLNVPLSVANGLGHSRKRTICATLARLAKVTSPYEDTSVINYFSFNELFVVVFMYFFWYRQFTYVHLLLSLLYRLLGTYRYLPFVGRLCLFVFYLSCVGNTGVESGERRDASPQSQRAEDVIRKF